MHKSGCFNGRHVMRIKDHWSENVLFIWFRNTCQTDMMNDLFLVVDWVDTFNSWNVETSYASYIDKYTFI